MRLLRCAMPLSMTSIIFVVFGCSRCHAFQPATSSLVKQPSCMIQEVQRYPTSTRNFSTMTQLCMAGGKNKKNLSASERERRDEENRRRGRKDEVVPGMTSAKPGEKDYELDPKATEMEWLRQASNVQQEVYAYTDKGMELLKLLRLEEASEAFDHVFELKPNAYLWQAGIAKFYLGELEEAASIFARNARLFESKFGGPASEERIWRDACELKLASSMSRRQRKKLEETVGISSLLTQIPEVKPSDPKESRKALRLTRDLFSASVGKDYSLQLLSRARLTAIGGAIDDRPKMDRKMWKLMSWFYLGLHYDTVGNEEDSKRCIKQALQLCPSGGGDDIIHTLPMLHMSAREWFDDTSFEEDSDLMSAGRATFNAKGGFSSSSTDLNGYTAADPVIEASIRDGVSRLKLHEIQSALRLRGLKVFGSKECLQEKLFNSLMEDAGFDSGFAP